MTITEPFRAKLQYGLAIAAGVCIAVALPGFNILPAGFVGITLFVFMLEGTSFRRTMQLSGVAGLSTGLVYFTWAFQASNEYAGFVSAQSVLVYLVLSANQAIWMGLLGVLLFFVHRNPIGSSMMRALLTGAAFVSWEWCFQNAIPSLPWIMLISYTQWNNVPLIQYASFGGIWLVTFIVAAGASAVADGLRRKNSTHVLVAIGLLVVVHAIGWFRYRNVESDERERSSSLTNKPVNVSILQENVGAMERWDYGFVDSLAHIFLKLNDQAVLEKPDIILWTESAIPWTFRADDDLIKEVLKRTYPSGATHLIGMLAPADRNGDVFNAVYLIEPDGAVRARYDKRELLAFLEKPLIASSWQLPFSQSRYKNILAGSRNNILPSRRSNIGVMICNESLSPYAALEAVRRGAQVLAVVANDGWFYRTVMVDAHLALTRFRAVETGRTVLFNANRGYGGAVRASGDMDVLSPSDTARTIPVAIYNRETKTWYAQFPDAFAYGCLAAVVMALAIWPSGLRSSVARKKN